MLHTQKNNQGFTLLFASLISALVLAVGIAILNISLKQLVLSSAGKESQQSFYSADSGIECALYLDRGAGTDCKVGFFGTPSTTESGAPSGVSICGVSSGAGTYTNLPGYECFGRNISISVGANVNNTVVNSFVLDNENSLANSNTNENMCFVVSVIKKIEQNLATSTTIIESRGYNTCNTDGRDRFERAIRTVNY